MRYLFCPNDVTKTTFRVGTKWCFQPGFGECWGCVVRGNEAEGACFITKHHAKRCAADMCRAFKHLLEHRLQFAWRRADDLEYLRSRRLLLERLGQFLRARLHLV